MQTEQTAKAVRDEILKSLPSFIQPNSEMEKWHVAMVNAETYYRIKFMSQNESTDKSDIGSNVEAYVKGHSPLFIQYLYGTPADSVVAEIRKAGYPAPTNVFCTIRDVCCALADSAYGDRSIASEIRELSCFPGYLSEIPEPAPITNCILADNKVVNAITDMMSDGYSVHRISRASGIQMIDLLEAYLSVPKEQLPMYLKADELWVQGRSINYIAAVLSINKEYTMDILKILNYGWIRDPMDFNLQMINLFRINANSPYEVIVGVRDCGNYHATPIESAVVDRDEVRTVIEKLQKVYKDDMAPRLAVMLNISTDSASAIIERLG